MVVLGLAYKPGVDDVRESPALSVLGHLVEGGADCAYHDPYVPSVRVGGRRRGDHPRLGEEASYDDAPELASVPLDDEVLAGADCVVILTAHPGIDYDAVVATAPLVFDAVGATRRRRADHVVLL